MSVNKVSILGNLTADPELKALPSGDAVANFSVACNRKYKDKEGVLQDTVEFINCVVFGKRAEAVARFKKKGDQIYCEGRLQTRSWEKDGQKHYRTEVVLHDVQFIGRKEEGATPQTAPPPQTAPAPTPPTSAEKVAKNQPEYPDEDAKPEDIPF